MQGDQAEQGETQGETQGKTQGETQGETPSKNQGKTQAEMQDEMQDVMQVEMQVEMQGGFMLVQAVLVQPHGSGKEYLQTPAGRSSGLFGQWSTATATGLLRLPAS